MTRAAEFCYIAERQADKSFLQAIKDNGRGIVRTLWTTDAEMALRISAAGRAGIVNAITSAHSEEEPMSMVVGFRKVLAG